jgi:hypothetical protein
MKLSIFDDATQQKLGIKKFISGEENVTVSWFFLFYLFAIITTWI